MKIERINENQIRCTLNKADLADRDLLLNELAYGTDKAKALFRDMMQQASYELGFEAEDIPLMIEAIPVSPECLILVITKVEDPEELDTRFSKFSKPSEYEEIEEQIDEDEEEDDPLDEPGGLMNLLNQIDTELDNLDISDETDRTSARHRQSTSKTAPTPASKQAISTAPIPDIHKIFLFQKLYDVTAVSRLLQPIYNGQNTLYKNSIDHTYYLTVSKSDHTPELFNKVCNILSEYGRKLKNTYATTAYMEEHFQTVIKDNAIQVLSGI